MKERLIEFLTYLDISQRKFEMNCGLSNGFVDKVGDSIRKGNLNKISKIYPELNVNWLKTGVGDMTKNGNLNMNVEKNNNEFSYQSKESESISYKDFISAIQGIIESSKEYQKNETKRNDAELIRAEAEKGRVENDKINLMNMKKLIDMIESKEKYKNDILTLNREMQDTFSKS